MLGIYDSSLQIFIRSTKFLEDIQKHHMAAPIFEDT